MKNFFAFIILLTLCPGVILRAEKVLVIPDAFKRADVIVDNTHFCLINYLTCKIGIYSLTDGKKISEFGGEGQGPGEFSRIGYVTLANDTVYVDAFPKMCIYSKKGKLLSEMKSSANIGSFIPLGKNFVGTRFSDKAPTAKMSTAIFSLHDSDLKKKKDILQSEMKSYVYWGGKKDVVVWVRDCVGTASYKKKLFICDTSKGFHIDVFDQDGNRLYEINKTYEKRKITDDIKKRILDRSKKNFGEQRWKVHNQRCDIVFPDYFPAFENFTVADEKIYVFSHPIGKNRDVQILDLKGNLIKRKTVPDLIDLGIAWREGPKIVNGKFYYMVENENAEVWELHSLSLD